MTKYTDYIFYKDIYKGDMSESNFDKTVIRASYEVQKNIFNRDITDYKDEVQLATCSVADILFKIEQLENKKNATISEKTLKSESVGDYSRTFDTSSISDIEKEISNQKSKIVEEIKKYLLNTGLLFRGI